MNTDKNAMVIRADAKAMGAITAHRPGGARHSDNYRTRCIALSECVSYNPSNGQTIDDATVFTATRKVNTHSKQRAYNKARAAETRAAIDHALMAGMGTIHEGEVN